MERLDGLSVLQKRSKSSQTPSGLESLVVAPPTSATTTKKKKPTITQVPPFSSFGLSPEPRPALIHGGWSRPTSAAVAHFQQIPAGLEEAGEKTFLHHYTWAKRNYR